MHVPVLNSSSNHAQGFLDADRQGWCTAQNLFPSQIYVVLDTAGLSLIVGIYTDNPRKALRRFTSYVRSRATLRLSRRPRGPSWEKHEIGGPPCIQSIW